FFRCSRAHRALPSFPTRRSSDLIRRAPPARSSDDAERPAFRPERIDRLLRGRFDGDLVVILHPLGDVAADVEEPERVGREASDGDRKSTRLNSSHVKISYAVFCL